ncbi:hypothetical protein C9374_006979 [Naegleria lovaniensis]|uniref:Uncharacterized protein n=1 Tax=Naegleria lovaniensis TaxID=51637 RepID=A0AA88H2M7_NAELO|nr:uncharacterized protein C9374_006979 [Naegleria lovaniensis]KAG2393448.1 hypothetical protein C9374_006979 [Naegleria lovaniensis]
MTSKYNPVSVVHHHQTTSSRITPSTNTPVEQHQSSISQNSHKAFNSPIMMTTGTPKPANHNTRVQTATNSTSSSTQQQYSDFKQVLTPIKTQTRLQQHNSNKINQLRNTTSTPIHMDQTFSISSPRKTLEKQHATPKAHTQPQSTKSAIVNGLDLFLNINNKENVSPSTHNLSSTFPSKTSSLPHISSAPTLDSKHVHQQLTFQAENETKNIESLILRLLSLENPVVNKKMTNVFSASDDNFIKLLKVVTDPLSIGIAKKDTLMMGEKLVHIIFTSSGPFEELICMNLTITLKELCKSFGSGHYFHDELVVKLIKQLYVMYRTRVFTNIQSNNLFPFISSNTGLVLYLLTEAVSVSTRIEDDRLKFVEYFCAQSSYWKLTETSYFVEIWQLAIRLLQDHNFGLMFQKLQESLFSKVIDQWLDVVKKRESYEQAVEYLQLLNNLVRETSNSALDTVTNFHFKLLKTLLEKRFTFLTFLLVDDYNMRTYQYGVQFSAYSVKSRFTALRLELVYLITFVVHFSYLDCIEKSVFQLYPFETNQMISILTEYFFTYNHCNVFHNIYCILFMEVIFRNEGSVIRHFLECFFHKALQLFENKHKVDQWGHTLQLLNMIRLSSKCSSKDMEINKFLFQQHLSEWTKFEEIIVQQTLLMEGLKSSSEIDIGSTFAERFGFMECDRLL